MSDVKRIDIAEFRERGYLQEVNRCFLHPLGLALEMRGGYTAEDVHALLPDDNTDLAACDAVWAAIQALGLNRPHLSGVWDYRDDPEGMGFGPDVIDGDKARAIEDEREAKRAERERVFGGIVQPVGDAS